MSGHCAALPVRCLRLAEKLHGIVVIRSSHGAVHYLASSTPPPSFIEKNTLVTIGMPPSLRPACYVLPRTFFPSHVFLHRPCDLGCCSNCCWLRWKHVLSRFSDLPVVNIRTKMQATYVQVLGFVQNADRPQQSGYI